MRRKESRADWRAEQEGKDRKGREGKGEETSLGSGHKIAQEHFTLHYSTLHCSLLCTTFDCSLHLTAVYNSTLPYDH